MTVTPTNVMTSFFVVRSLHFGMQKIETLKRGSLIFLATVSPFVRPSIPVNKKQKRRNEEKTKKRKTVYTSLSKLFVKFKNSFYFY